MNVVTGCLYVYCVAIPTESFLSNYSVSEHSTQLVAKRTYMLLLCSALLAVVRCGLQHAGGRAPLLPWRGRGSALLTDNTERTAGLCLLAADRNVN